jgi:predicted PurR-regulated permease PerM
MKNSQIRVAAMTVPYDTKNQRVLWGAALVVGFILIYYGRAPVFPVLAGCVLVPAIAALRSWFRSRR